MKKNFEVTLFNQKFSIKTDSEERYVQRVADYVNKKLFDVQEKTKSVSSLHISLLAALNISDDYFKMKNESKDRVNHARVKIKEIVGLIDRCIEGYSH